MALFGTGTAPAPAQANGDGWIVDGSIETSEWLTMTVLDDAPN